MCPAIDNPASCEIRSVIRFLHNTSMSAAEIHLELCAVCCQNIMSEGTVRQWRRMFKRWAGEVVGWPSVVNDDLVQSVDKIFVKDGASQF
jgi:hypothetical protein